MSKERSLRYKTRNSLRYKTRNGESDEKQPNTEAKETYYGAKETQFRLAYLRSAYPRLGSATVKSTTKFRMMPIIHI